MNRNWNHTARMLRKQMRRDRLLHKLGLEERHPTGDLLGGLGLFALGLAVGAGIALMFAPRPGNEMRNVVSDTWRQRMHRRREGADLDLGSESAPSSVVP